jgi:hypothetical protein
VRNGRARTAPGRRAAATRTPRLTSHREQLEEPEALADGDADSERVRDLADTLADTRSKREGVWTYEQARELEQEAHAIRGRR